MPSPVVGFLLTAQLLALPGVRVSRAVVVMGTQLKIDVIAASRPAALEATEASYQAVLRADALLSTWHASSLDSLNQATVGDTTAISTELLSLLHEVLPWRDSTGGAFEPVSGALADAWDLRGAGRVPSTDQLRRALASTGAEAMEIRDKVAVRQRGGAWLDSGAFGKGAALRMAARALQHEGIQAALLDFGGQVLAVGAPDHAGGWTVAVADPRDRQRSALELLLRDVSASTSAQSERFVTVDGHRYGHILDPHTGRPVSAWGSVTVIAADPMLADILSTALFVMGPEQGLAWANRHPSIGAVFLVSSTAGTRCVTSVGARKFVVPSDSQPAP
ncbi:MAG TPA: FAD:protein FMN transferase [Gemmatimonadales bacterium]|nr:FAD:protein FMN transferase [Gemmatimonadales bacterium]